MIIQPQQKVESIPEGAIKIKLIDKYQCSRCKQIFPKKYNLIKHLKRKYPCLNENQSNQTYPINENIESKTICFYCNNIINHENLAQHHQHCIQYRSYFLLEIDKIKTQFQKQIDELKQQNNSSIT